MDLPMAPALGLYLGEVFFDGYNAKQAKEMANDKRLAALRANKVVVPAPVAPTEDGKLEFPVPISRLCSRILIVAVWFISRE